MYDIYIKNYLNDDRTDIVSSEVKLYSIPINSDSYTLRTLVNPTVKLEMGKAGSMDFSIHPDHQFYDRFAQMLTVIRVVYDGTTIFRGRVLTIDDSHFTGDRKIHLEGDMAFFMDTQLAGVKEEKRSVQSIQGYLQNVLNEHNEQIQNDETRVGPRHDKYFLLGEVPGFYTDGVTSDAQRIVIPDKNFGNDSWRKTMDEFEALRKEYGGFFRTRYVSTNSGNHHYLTTPTASDTVQSYTWHTM